MKNLIKTTRPVALGIALLSTAFSAQAVNTLQVGVPAGSSDTGTYGDYLASTSSPVEEDTAITSGSTILFAGVTGVLDNNNVSQPTLLQLGGKYTTGKDWSEVDTAMSAFNGHGAIALLAVEDGKLSSGLSGGITLGGLSAFYSSATLSGLFPNNHDPLKDAISDFLFFDIGNFVGTTLIPNFADEKTGNPTGQIKSLALDGTNLASFNWIHFDLLALATDFGNGNNSTTLISTIKNNPGSHDVTWKNPGTPPCTNPQGCVTQETPEPDMLALMGIGLLGMAMTYVRKRSC